MSDETRLSPESNEPQTVPVAQDRFVAFLAANNDWPQMNAGIQAVLGHAIFNNPPQDFTTLLTEHMTDHQTMVVQLSMDQRHGRAGVAYQSELKKEPNAPHVVYQSRLTGLYTNQRNEVLARGLAFLSGEELVNSAEDLTTDHIRQLTLLWNDPAKAKDVAFLRNAYARMVEFLTTPPAQEWARLQQDIEVQKHRKKLENNPGNPWKLRMDRLIKLFEGEGGKLIAGLDEERKNKVSRDLSMGNIDGVIGTVLEDDISKFMEQEGGTYPVRSIRVITRGGMLPMSARNKALMNFP